MNVIFIIFWLLLNWRYFLIFALISVGLMPVFSLNYKFSGEQSTGKPSDFKLVTYNLHYLKGDGTDKLITQMDFDVFLYQEAHGKDLEKIKNSFFNGHFFERYEIIGCFSKYPIIETKPILDYSTLPETGSAAYFDIDRGVDTIRLINVYLEPMRIGKDLVRSVINAKDESVLVEKNLEIKNLLVNGMEIHEYQIKQILPYIVNSKYPVIVAGDFNSTPKSYEYYQFSKHLTDTFAKVGTGNATTFHGFRFPLRLDYIFVSNEIEPVSTWIIREKLSDHYPVLGEFKIR